MISLSNTFFLPLPSASTPLATVTCMDVNTNDRCTFSMAPLWAGPYLLTLQSPNTLYIQLSPTASNATASTINVPWRIDVMLRATDLSGASIDQMFSLSPGENKMRPHYPRFHFLFLTRRFIAAIPSAPSVSVAAPPTATSVQVSIAAPFSDGQNAIVAVDVTVTAPTLASFTPVTQRVPVPSTPRWLQPTAAPVVASFTSLPSGSSFSVSAKAVNAVGASASSMPLSFTTLPSTAPQTTYNATILVSS